jgi:hypothetical protein
MNSTWVRLRAFFDNFTAGLKFMWLWGMGVEWWMLCYFGKLAQIGFILQHLPVHKPSKGWLTVFLLHALSLCIASVLLIQTILTTPQFGQALGQLKLTKIWYPHTQTWVQRALIQDMFCHCFCPAVQIFLSMFSAAEMAHSRPTSLEVGNTTSMSQPMDWWKPFDPQNDDSTAKIADFQVKITIWSHFLNVWKLLTVTSPL